MVEWEEKEGLHGRCSRWDWKKMVGQLKDRRNVIRKRMFKAKEVWQRMSSHAHRGV